MNAQAKEVSGELLDSMPTPPAPQNNTALVGANPYLSIIETMVARGGDLPNLSQMLDLQIKWEANEARKAYVAAMAAFKTEPMEILKRKQVSFKTNSGKTEYMHAELSDVTDAVVPAMGKHGLSHRWDVKQEGAQITVACTITHALGHSEVVAITAAPDNSGGKNAIQSVASTISYLQRYTLLAATGMATKGMDDDGRGYDASTNADAYQEWFDKIAAADSLPTLRKVKDEMLAKIGDDKNRVPTVTLEAYNARVAELTA